MKFAKKLVLVPSDRYEQMQNLLLSKENEKALEEDTSQGIQQQQQQQQQLGEGSVTDRATVPTPVSKGESEEKGTVSEPLPEKPSYSGSLEDQQIVDSVGRKFRNKTANLLSYVRKVNPKEMTWNDKGEISYKGDVIAGSNIIDLMRTAMHNVPSTLNLPGSSAFQSLLHESNVPLTLIGNNKWRAMFQDLKAGRPVHTVDDKVPSSKRIVNTKGIVKKKQKTKDTKKKVVKWISL